MDVARQIIGWHGQARRVRAGSERGFRVGPAEHARAGTGDGHAPARLMLRDIDADHGIARGRVTELGIGGSCRDGEADAGDDLAIGQRRGEHALEEVIGTVGSAISLDQGIKGEHGGRIIGGRIIVGEAAAQRAAVAHLRIADAGGKAGQARNGGGAGCDIGMAGHRADPQAGPVAADAGKAQRRQIDQRIGHAQPRFHRRNQRVATGQIGSFGGARKLRGGFRQAARTVEGEFMHPASPPWPPRLPRLPSRC